MSETLRSVRSLRALPIGLVAVGVLAGGLAARQGERRPVHQELPDDAPGTPATALSVPSVARTLGSFTSVQVNVAPGGANIVGDAANEPSIAVDPTAPNRITIGWRQFDTTSSNFRQAGRGYSRDGGRSWTFPGVIDPGVFRSDPVLGFDASGAFYYNSLTVNGSDFLCDVYESNDGGETWGDPVSAFGGDKQWMAVDRTGGIGHGHVYSAWSIFASCCAGTFTRSTDEAQSFETPTVLADSPVFGTMAVGPDGEVYVAGADPSDFSSFLVAKSTTARNSALPSTFPTITSVDLGGELGIFGGGPNPDGLLGQVNIVVDTSGGPFSGNVYMLCSVIPPGPDPLDVHFSRSVDGGQTWSTPVRVNDDAVGNWQWFGTLAIAPGGRLDVVWNDTRDSGQTNLSRLYHSSSADGGATWSANEVLSNQWDSFVGWPNQNKIGDYYDMISDEVGAHLAWSATFNGEQDVYYLRIGDYDCNQNGLGDAEDIAMGLSFDANGNTIPDECESLGLRYCDPAVPNSTGESGVVAVTGSLVATDDQLALSGTRLPHDVIGYFIMGTGTNTFTPPGSDGPICVTPGLKRFLPPVLNTGPQGAFAHEPGTQNIPNVGTILAGETWNFQAWTRDFNPDPTSNFTDAVSITFL